MSHLIRCVLGLAVVLCLEAPGLAQQKRQDAERKVTGGVTARGWTGKEDAGNAQGLTVQDSKFADEGDGYRVVTGPPALYWNPANTASGDFTVKATFTEQKQIGKQPLPFGLFIAGSALDSDAPSALYCAVYRNGTYIVRMYGGGKQLAIVRRPARHASVKKVGPKDEYAQELALAVKGDAVQCLVDGWPVWTGTRASLTGDGKLPSLDGIVGIRVSHSIDVKVTGFALTK